MRLIDETAYQDKLAKIPMGERFFVKAVETAQHMQTIDAVKVVRCHDCVHFGECLVTGNDYCSYGERKENEQWSAKHGDDLLTAMTMSDCVTA